MSDLAKRQYLFVLPLPLTPPSHIARLGGIVFVRTDAALNIIGKKEFIACRQPVHQLPSPAYLFSQGIVPTSLTSAISEYAFITRLKELFTGENLYIVTYGANYLEYIYSICSRIFVEEDPLSKCYCVLDLKTAFNAHALFAQPEFLKCGDNLKSRAQTLGYDNKVQNKDLMSRLDMLIYCFKTLKHQNPRLVNYLMQSSLTFRKYLVKAINDSQILAYADNTQKKVELIKPLSVHESILKTLCIQDNMPCIKAINLNLFELIAPKSILTNQRLELLNIDLAFNCDMLEKADLNIAHNEFKLPHYLEYKNSLDNTDKTYIHTIAHQNPQSLTQPPPHIGSKLRHDIFLFRAENFIGTLLDQELHLYYTFAREALEKQISRYYKECRLLSAGIDENDEAGAKLLEEIMNYPSTL